MSKIDYEKFKELAEKKNGTKEKTGKADGPTKGK